MYCVVRSLSTGDRVANGMNRNVAPNIDVDAANNNPYSFGASMLAVLTRVLEVTRAKTVHGVAPDGSTVADELTRVVQQVSDYSLEFMYAFDNVYLEHAKRKVAEILTQYAVDPSHMTVAEFTVAHDKEATRLSVELASALGPNAQPPPQALELLQESLKVIGAECCVRILNCEKERLGEALAKLAENGESMSEEFAAMQKRHAESIEVLKGVQDELRMARAETARLEEKMQRMANERNNSSVWSSIADIVGTVGSTIKTYLNSRPTESAQDVGPYPSHDPSANLFSV
eukprot:GFYU01002475.1.p2 GENE.GFYU01002475.1~~GFYU01002475.1.p2  ORF type:complete len:288 (-),score=59.73 GFYU01002475.1:80-943(-)